MSDWDGEPAFDVDATETAEAIATAQSALTSIKAYVLSEDEMESFKEAQMALRDLNHGFEQYRGDSDE